MRFLSMIRVDEKSGRVPSEQLMSDMGRLIEEMTRAGVRKVIFTSSLYAYGRAGRPCRRCGTPIAVARQGTDLPRSTYWCPTCQGPGAGA